MMSERVQPYLTAGTVDVLLIISVIHSAWVVVAHVTYVLLVVTVLCQLESFLCSFLFFVDL